MFEYDEIKEFHWIKSILNIYSMVKAPMPS